MGAPMGRGQYVSSPGMTKIALPALVAAAWGMHRWLQCPRECPHDETEEATGLGARDWPPRKATKVAPLATSSLCHEGSRERRHPLRRSGPDGGRGTRRPT